MEENIEHPVLATTKSARTTVDGGLTITIEIMPSDVMRAFPLFGIQGSAMAVVPVNKDVIRRETQKATAASAAGPFNRTADPAQIDIEDVIIKKQTERRSFLDLPRTAQAAIRCGEPMFWSFLHQCKQAPMPHDKDDAANAVRAMCGVTSRRELNEHPDTAGAAWDHLEGEFYAWAHGAR